MDAGKRKGRKTGEEENLPRSTSAVREAISNYFFFYRIATLARRCIELLLLEATVTITYWDAPDELNLSIFPLGTV